jgi:short-subunit dehydrogenase
MKLKRRSRIRALFLAAAGLGAARALGRALTGDLSGSVVLITGGSRGLGLLLAEEFAGMGCRLVLCARDERELARASERLAARGAEVLTVATDVARRTEVDRAVQSALARFGRVDVLVNNASVIQVGPFEAMTDQDFQDALAVNFWGTLHGVLAVLPSMRERRSGRIVNITSIGGRVAVPHLLPYDCAKFAAYGLSEGLFAELRKDGISVTTVVPGLMRTGSPENAFFKGKKALEFAWFAAGDSQPLTAMSARRAARRIARAAKRREPYVTLSWQAKLLRLGHDLFPTATMYALSAAARLMPRPDGPAEATRGLQLPAPRPLLALLYRAAGRTNEYASKAARRLEPEPKLP